MIISRHFGRLDRYRGDQSAMAVSAGRDIVLRVHRPAQRDLFSVNIDSPVLLVEIICLDLGCRTGLNSSGAARQQARSGNHGPRAGLPS